MLRNQEGGGIFYVPHRILDFLPSGTCRVLAELSHDFKIRAPVSGEVGITESSGKI